MSEREIGKEILEGIREIKAFKAGKMDLVTRKLSDPSDPKTIRGKIESISSSFCGIDGGECANCSGLGTKSAGAEWSSKVVIDGLLNNILKSSLKSDNQDQGSPNPGCS